LSFTDVFLRNPATPIEGDITFSNIELARYADLVLFGYEGELTSVIPLVADIRPLNSVAGITEIHERRIANSTDRTFKLIVYERLGYLIYLWFA
jgi:hypothetical protein